MIYLHILYALNKENTAILRLPVKLLQIRLLLLIAILAQLYNWAYIHVFYIWAHSCPSVRVHLAECPLDVEVCSMIVALKWSRNRAELPSLQQATCPSMCFRACMSVYLRTSPKSNVPYRRAEGPSFKAAESEARMQDFRYAVQRRVVCAATKQSRAPVDQRKTSASRHLVALAIVTAIFEATDRPRLFTPLTLSVVQSKRRKEILPHPLNSRTVEA